MGGFFSSNKSCLNEWKCDDIYNDKLKEIKSNNVGQRLPSKVDFSDTFMSLNSVGDNNIHKCIHYLFLFCLNQVDSLPYDYEEHFNFNTFLEVDEQSSIGKLLFTLQEHYQENVPFVETIISPIKMNEIKNNIRNGCPLLVSFPVNIYNFENTTKSNPLSNSDDVTDETDTNFVGIIVGYNKDIYKVMLGNSDFFYVTKEYIDKTVNELWSLKTKIHQRTLLPYLEEDLVRAKALLKSRTKKKKKGNKNKKKRQKKISFLYDDDSE
jgi:hypothetical protein